VASAVKKPSFVRERGEPASDGETQARKMGERDSDRAAGNAERRRKKERERERQRERGREGTRVRTRKVRTPVFFSGARNVSRVPGVPVLVRNPRRVIRTTGPR